MDDSQHPVTRAIRQRVDAHEIPPGVVQWWVDEHSIDCDADEFWAVVDKAVRASLAEPAERRSGEWAQDASGGQPTIRANSVITVTDPG